jgi:type VI secretion system protein ImpK
MSGRLPTVATYRGSDSGLSRRKESLALAYQEIFTAIVRLRVGRQAVSDAESFRVHFREALRVAEQEGRSRGYTPEDVQWATFAVVAFLDESVLSSHNPVLANWPRLPLQEELFGGHLAGEAFFRNLRNILERKDSNDVADLLEVYELCLLLGYKGKYGVGGAGEVRSIVSAVSDKIHRVRGSTPGLSPTWVIPKEAPKPVKHDRWIRRLSVTAVALLALGIILFAVCDFLLISGAQSLAAIARGHS